MRRHVMLSMLSVGLLPALACSGHLTRDQLFERAIRNDLDGEHFTVVVMPKPCEGRLPLGFRLVYELDPQSAAIIGKHWH